MLLVALGWLTLVALACTGMLIQGLERVLGTKEGIEDLEDQADAIMKAKADLDRQSNQVPPIQVSDNLLRSWDPKNFS